MEAASGSFRPVISFLRSQNPNPNPNFASRWLSIATSLRSIFNLSHCSLTPVAFARERAFISLMIRPRRLFRGAWIRCFGKNRKHRLETTWRMVRATWGFCCSVGPTTDVVELGLSDTWARAGYARVGTNACTNKQTIAYGHSTG